MTPDGCVSTRSFNAAYSDGICITNQPNAIVLRRGRPPALVSCLIPVGRSPGALLVSTLRSIRRSSFHRPVDLALLRSLEPGKDGTVPTKPVLARGHRYLIAVTAEPAVVAVVAAVVAAAAAAAAVAAEQSNRYLDGGNVAASSCVVTVA